MRIILVLLILLLNPALSFSQNKPQIYTISGKIVDAATKKPLEDATIIFKSIDSNQIKFGGITNQRGNFSIDVEEGTYNVTTEIISYKTKKLNISTISRDYNIGTIYLEIDSFLLNEINITAEKKALTIKPNKQIFNISNDPAAASSTTTEILSKLPSVNVDLDGNIQLRGQSNVTILINGKLSSFSKSEALKTIPASSIQDVVVITNPGARYRASSSGVINIILKKGKDKGLNSSLTLNGGYNDYYGGLFTLNHKSKKVNFYSNTSFLKRNPIKETSILNEYFNNGSTIGFMNEDRITRGNGNVLSSYVGFDFSLSRKSKLTTSLKYTYINDINETNTLSNFFDENNIFTDVNIRFNDGTFKDEIFEFIVDYELEFNKDGQKLKSSLTYSNDVEKYNNVFSNTNINFLNEDYLEKNTLNNTTAELTFINPIGETAELQIGYLGEFGYTPFTYNGTVNNSQINFNDTNHSFFVNFSKQVGEFYYELGLRSEFLQYKIDYLNQNSTLKKQFDNLFPSAYVEYAFSDTKNLSFSYSKSYIPVGYSYLQPFEQRISETVSFKGNENLNPMFSDHFNLSYLVNGNNLTFSIAAYYNNYNDYYQLVTFESGEQVNGLNKLMISPFNFGNLEQLGVDVTGIIKVNNMLNFTGNANLFNSKQTGILNIVDSNNNPITRDYSNSSLEGSLSFSTKLKIPNVFEFQTNIKHILPVNGAFSVRKAYSYVGLAISKDIINKQATIGLSSSDLFNSMNANRNRYDIDYFSASTQYNKYPTILMSFTYRFNQKKQDRLIDFKKKEVKTNI